MSRLGIRKLISHYLNSNDRHKMINSHSSQSTGTSGFHGTEPRPSVIAQVPATQKATELKPSVTNHFVLGKKQQNVNYCANLNRNFPVNAPMESKKPELLRYLGGSCKLCAVCGQEKIWHGQNTNGICASCNAKIQGALGNFKRQQQQQGSGGQRIKGALDRQCTMGCSCQDPCSCENRRQQEEQRRITKEKHRQQRKPERERVKSGQQSQPFSIIVLQDCNNNNLIDQLTAALTVGCQQDNAATEQPQSNGYNKNGPGKAGTTIGNAVPPEYGMGNEVQKPDNFACTCDCQACRTGFENTLKLPMLMAQALEIFVMKNSLSDKMAAQKSKSDIKKSSSTSVQGKGQKRQAQLGAEESSTSVRIKKSKGKKRDKTQSKSKDMPRSQTNDKVKQKPDKFRGDKDKGKGGRSQPKSKDLPKSQSDVSYKQKSNDKIKSDKFKESFKQKSRGDEGGKGKRRKDKKNLREEINQTKFFLPPKKPDQTACLENSRYPCSEQRNTGCVPGCQDANGNCTRFSGGCSQSNLLSGCSCSSPAVNKASKQMDRNVGAGDQPSHGHCSRSFNCQGCNPGYCLGCSSCGYFSFRPPRENMHPIAHFRPGVNLYPANCVFLRNGDFVRRSLVRTAAGVTLHEVQRERELESKQPMTNPYPNPIPRYPSTFPCGSNFQFWR